MVQNAKFTVQFKVNSHDTDKNGNVRPSVILRYFHEAANLQFESSSTTLDILRKEQNKAFLLSRASVELTRQLRAFEEITVRTWAAGGRGATFYRAGELLAGDEIVARLVSLWALVDLSDRRLCRVKDTKLDLPTLEEYPLPIPGHLRMPKGGEEMMLRGKRLVQNSDIDLNCHVNNTNYPDMMSNYIPGIENKKVCAFTVSYIHEAPLGAELSVLHCEEEGVQYIRTLRPDGTVNAEASFVLEDVA